MATAGASCRHLGDGSQRADHRRDQRDDPRSRVDVRVVLEEQEREVEEVGVEARQPVAEPCARKKAQHDPNAGDSQHELHVVAGDGGRTIADRLQQADLLALQRDQAHQRHVDEERRHQEEDRRDHPAQGVELLELGVQEGMGELVLAAVGAGAAIAGEQTVQLLDHAGLGGARQQLQAHRIEGAVEIEQRRRSLLRHPHDRKAAVVGHQVAWPQRVDELRRQGDAHHLQLALLAVEDGLDGGAEAEAMRPGERIVDGDLVGPLRFRQAAFAQMQAVETLRHEVGKRDDLSGRGLLHALHVEQGEPCDAGLRRRHPRDRQDLLGQRLRRAPHLGEHVGEPVALVVGAARLVERAIGAARQHEGGGPRRHDEGNGQRLRPHAPQVPYQLAVEHAHGAHQLIAEAGLRLSLA